MKNYTPPTHDDEQDMENNELVVANIPYAVDRAKMWWNLNKGGGAIAYTLDDYVGAAYEGLVVASKRFDRSKGYKFITYAVWHIDQKIRIQLQKDTVVHIPSNRRQDYFKLIKESKEEMNYQEVGERLGWDEGRIEKALTGNWRPVHRFEPETHEYKNVVDEVPSYSEYDETASRVREMVKVLGEREKTILQMYFWDGLTLQEIGDHLGVTRERTRQIREAALRKLRVKFGDVAKALIPDAEHQQGAVCGLAIMEGE